MKVSDKKARLHFNRWSKSTKRTQNTGKKHFSYSSIMPYWNGTFKLMYSLPTTDGVSKVYIYSGVMTNTHFAIEDTAFGLKNLITLSSGGKITNPRQQKSLIV